MSSHWQRHAQQWALLGPPLRPSPEDVALVGAHLGRARRALLLGATPELATLLAHQVADTDAPPTVLAVDRVPAMIHAILPRAVPSVRGVVGDWLALPIADHAIDVAVGDGALSCLPYPDGYAALAAELARVLSPGARFVARLFARPAPEAREPLAAIDPAAAGSFHALKWRIAMAAEHDLHIPVARILAAFDALVPDRARLPYPAAEVAMIDNYARSPLVYSFPTVDEAIAPFAAARFTAALLPAPTTYPLAERCPTVVFTAPTPAR